MYIYIYICIYIYTHQLNTDILDENGTCISNSVLVS